MHDFFEKYMTVNERNLAAQVEKEGGATRVRHEDAILKKLMGATGTKLEPAIGPVPEGRVDHRAPESSRRLNH